MTEIEKLLDKKPVSKSEISRRNGINASRLSKLSLVNLTHLTAEELYLTSLTIDTNPGGKFIEILKDLKLENRNA